MLTYFIYRLRWLGLLVHSNSKPRLRLALISPLPLRDFNRNPLCQIVNDELSDLLIAQNLC